MSQETGDSNYAVKPEDLAPGEEGGDEALVPEYEIDQYFPRPNQFSSEEYQRLQDQYGYIRAYFKAQPDRYSSFQRTLNQARMGTTYDVYLTRTVWYALLASLVGVVVGVGLTILLSSAGVFATISPPISVGSGIGSFVSTYRVPIGGAVLTVLSTLLIGGGTVAGRYYYPNTIVDSRERNIDIVLPHAIVYMYALSYGGMNTLEVIRKTAQTEEVYGEVANEFDMIVRDVELFGNDLFTAIRDARNLTPSDNLEQFLDDMISVLDSGSDITVFFGDESENYMEEAREEQDSFLETLSILSEIFVVAFVAAPLFLIVTLVVISLLGGSGALTQTYLLVYIGLPVGMVSFLVIVGVLSQPYEQPRTLKIAEEEELDQGLLPDTTVEEGKDPRLDDYRERRRREELIESVKDPVALVRERNPLFSLALTLPLALVVIGLASVSGFVTVSPAGFDESPLSTTFWLAAGPFLVMAVPLSLLHETKRRREQQIASRFPDTLNILSSANQMGIRLTEALDLVSRWSEGILARELRKVRNDIKWNHDVRRALLSFANRLSVPQVTRTMKLIAEGSQSSGDLSKILSIAAEDTRNRYKLEEQRRRAMGAYIAIVVIGFLVYLAVVVMIDVSYLTPIGRLTAETAESQTPGAVLNVTAVPVEAYRTVFFHSALIQGFGSGLLAGKLADNDMLSGLKYSIGLVTLTLAVFAFI